MHSTMHTPLVNLCHFLDKQKIRVFLKHTKIVFFSTNTKTRVFLKRTKSVGMLGSGSGGSGRVQKGELVISKIDEGPMVRRCRTGYGGQWLDYFIIYKSFRSAAGTGY